MNRLQPLLGLSLALLVASPLTQAQESGTRLDPPDAVLATRGTAVVQVADIDAFIEHVPVKDRPAVVGSDERINTVLQGILLNRQLHEVAVEAGLDQSEKVQREIQLAREQVLARHALKHVVERRATAELETLANEAYLADQAKYVVPESREVQHILVGTKERTDEEARALIEQILAEARKPGADFDALVIEHSEDSAKLENTGRYVIDATTAPLMDPAFVAGVEAMQEEGAISGPVSGMHGYHILRLVKYQPRRQLSFAEARPQIIENLRAAYAKRVEDEYVSSLRTQQPEIDDGVAQRLKTRYRQAVLAPALQTP